MSPAELSVWGLQEGKEYLCIMEAKETSNETDFFICEIQKTPYAKFQKLKVIFQSHSALYSAVYYHIHQKSKVKVTFSK